MGRRAGGGVCVLSFTCVYVSYVRLLFSFVVFLLKQAFLFCCCEEDDRFSGLLVALQLVGRPVRAHFERVNVLLCGAWNDVCCSARPEIRRLTSLWVTRGGGDIYFDLPPVSFLGPVFLRLSFRMCYFFMFEERIARCLDKSLWYVHFRRAYGTAGQT